MGFYDFIDKVISSKSSDNERQNIQSFLAGNGIDNLGRTLDDMLSWDFEQLENTHDYIQWLFPLPEGSSSNIFAPKLTEEDIDIISKCHRYRKNMALGFRKMLEFYGFEMIDNIGVCNIKMMYAFWDLDKFEMIDSMNSYYNETNLSIRKSESFLKHSRLWLQPGNHNFFRIKRILESMNTLGYDKHATLFFKELEKIYEDNKGVILLETLNLWRDAAMKGQCHEGDKLHRIKEVLDNRLYSYGFTFPVEDLRAKKTGKGHVFDFNFGWSFGKDEKGEFLELCESYSSTTLVPNMVSHIYEDGSSEIVWVYENIKPGVGVKEAEDIHARNDAVCQYLKDKGMR